MKGWVSIARLTLSVLVVGCSNPHSEPSDTPPVDTASAAFDDPECRQAEERLGYPACEHSIPDEDRFEAVMIASTAVDQL